MVQKDGFYGFINHQGEMLTSLDYQSAKHHNKQLILVEKEGKYTFLDKTVLAGQHMDFAGNPQFSEEYDMVISSYTDEFSIVVLGAKYGYIDETGEEVIAPMYDNATLFDGKIAAVQIGKKWGAIDKANEKLIDFKYDEMKPFNNDLSVVRSGKKWGAIDVQNKEVIPFKYKYLSNFNDDKIAIAKKGKNWGVINIDGEVLTDFEYDFDFNYLSLMQLTNGYLWLQKDNFWGTIDFKNNIDYSF
ncbi:MAG: WG repeat-containing protein [Saprospiraceae bacterium]|nr:WG repeat-containing protein [Saprospiraceae bacterium]